MNDFIITTDTTSDLPQDYIDKHKLNTLPLYYQFDETVYGGGNELDSKDFFDRMRKGSMPTTMAANPEAAREMFTSIIDKGLDIIHIALSSAISGSYSVAATVAREICEERPDAKISVIDSLGASLGEGLLVHKALQLKEEGKSFDEVVNWVEDNKLNLCHMFTVDDLNHLYRGGRVSKATAVIGTLIKVKPILHMDNDGRLVPLYNVRSRKKALTALVDNMEERIRNYQGENNEVFISHGDSIEDAEFVASLVRERFDIDNILINYVSPTIGAHSGPGTLALFFMGSER